MSTYAELMNVKNPVIGLPIYFEYVSKYRRVLLVKDGSSWIMKVSFHGDAKHIKSYKHTWGYKQDAYADAKSTVAFRDILMGASFTVKEAIGKTIIDKGF